jgi:phospho-N-acetylmuramoyl-pentapeptide-transferase
MVQSLIYFMVGFLATFILAVPFINLLYKLKFQRAAETHVLIPIFTKLHAWKVGTPNSGGILVILIVVVLGWLILQPRLDLYRSPIIIIFISLLLYGVLGLYDDIKKFFGYQKEKFWGMRMRYKLIIQIFIAALLGWLLFLHLNTSGTVALYIPFITAIQLPAAIYIAFAALTIIASANAFNITDGLDGLSSGLLLMTLLTLLAITLTTGGNNPFIATPYTGQLAGVLGLWAGATLAFLYFNIHPARVWMGDSGALAFGGTLGVITLLLGVPFVFIIIGGVYVLEAISTLLQWYSIRFMSHKIFLIAPIHHHFEAKGWPETKVTMRFWLLGASLSLLGLMIYGLLRFS